MKKIIGISIAVLVVLLAGSTYFGKQKYDSMLKAASQGLNFGEAYGKMINQSNCMLGLKVKYSSCSTMECELSANGYIAGCLDTAERDGFCSTVPNIKDTDKAVGWVAETCSEQRLAPEKCLKYMHKFVSVCTAQALGRTLSNTELFESGFKKGLNKGFEKN
jgi:hypothetical protein